jgi:hypothetical protein
MKQDVSALFKTLRLGDLELPKLIVEFTRLRNHAKKAKSHFDPL